MRRLVLLHIGVLTIATMVGCAKLLSIRPVTPERIDELVAAEEYGQALNLLNGVPETHPQYAVLHNKVGDVRKRAVDYEQSILDTVRTKMEQGDWTGALHDVNSGLDKFPSSVVLKQGREELLRKRAQRIHNLKTEILIAEGKWLAKEAPLREELARVVPKNLIVKWELWRTRNAVEKTAERLYKCGERATNDKNFEPAKRCLTLAERLDSSETMKAAVRELRQQIAEREEEAQRKEPTAHQGKLREDSNRLVELATQAIEKGQLQKARQIVAKLAEIDPDNPEVHQLEQRLDETVSAKVNKMLKRGSMLYRAEKVEEAKKIWEEVLQLDPSNKQAQAGVERAKRVLESLRLLREKEPPT